jgi:hypothetical protein
MELYNNEQLPAPLFKLINNGGGLVSIASANFYRTVNNANIQITLPLGLGTNEVFISPDTYLPISIFNKKIETTAIKYPNNRDVIIAQEILCRHDILIQYKLTKMDGSNFSNRREIRITLVKDDGSIYDESIIANYQPDTGQHDSIILNGTIMHKNNDVVKIKIFIIQDNKAHDKADTKLTIFQVSWNITALKNL